jgi:predicted nucleotide-binding protein
VLTQQTSDLARSLGGLVATKVNGPKIYVVGGKSASGHKIASILGQSPHGVVFTTKNNELRWAYWRNKGVMSESLKAVVVRFDTLMTRIASSAAVGDAKRELYMLLGKSLFGAIDAARPKSAKAAFAEVERQLAALAPMKSAARTRRASRRIFVVHGHDDAARESIARFLDRLELIPIVLKEQPNAGRTIIEKFEDESDVGFAVVLLTPDDIGGIAKSPRKLLPRARQNVIFELGYFAGALGRRHVVALVKDDIEIPSDYQGVVFIPMDKNDGWRLKVAQELKAGGLTIDLNKVA